MKRCTQNPINMHRMVVFKIDGKITPFFAQPIGTAHENLCVLAKDAHRFNKVELISSRLWIDKNHEIYSDNSLKGEQGPAQARAEIEIDNAAKEIAKAHQEFIDSGKKTSFSGKYTDFEIQNSMTQQDLDRNRGRNDPVNYSSDTGPNVSDCIKYFLQNDNDGLI